METTLQSEQEAFEQINIEKLERFVEETVSNLATSTNLQPSEALNILENIKVEMVGELRNAISVIGEVKQVDPAKLSMAIEKAIEAISFATDLSTEEITTIFSSRPGASLADVTYRLHRQSAHDRESF